MIENCRRDRLSINDIISSCDKSDIIKKSIKFDESEA